MFTWRREARKASETVPAFVPAVVAPEPVLTAELSAPLSRPKRRGRQRRAAAIEVDVAGVRVTIENGASPVIIAAVIGALKAGSCSVRAARFVLWWRRGRWTSAKGRGSPPWCVRPWAPIRSPARCTCSGPSAPTG
ncbi:hypothetical protein [Ancylobacter oerskovii]|uniref:Transposase n=1 Tax=Ancylobacter oerskovii TaxID=459519 RepID=A0ABW4Z5L0_9HYPH